MRTVDAANAAETKKQGFFAQEMRKLKKNKFLFFLMLPGLIYYIIFHYVPIYGLLIAFKDYKPTLGVFGSPWASSFGFGHLICLIMYGTQ